MTDKTSRRNRQKRNRWLLISAIAIFLVLISALATYSYLNQTGKPIVVYPADTYFAISDLAGTYETLGTTTYNGTGKPPTSVLINSLDFNFTPVGGDATGTRIFIQESNPQNTWWVNTIKNGTSTDAGEATQGDISLENPVLIPIQPDGTYHFPIQMQADNSNGQIDVNGTITLIFNATLPGGNFVSEGPENTG